MELGAQMAQIRPSLTKLSALPDLRRTARMPGRRYDAIECSGTMPHLVHQMGVDASVHVYDGVASPSHPTAKLMDLLDGAAFEFRPAELRVAGRAVKHDRVSRKP